MAERVQDKPELIAVSRLERWSLFGTVLVWLGVLTFGTGLFVTLRNERIERSDYAGLPTSTPTHEASAMGAEGTATSTPTPRAQIYPSGWSTATPTPVGRTPTPVPTRRSGGGVATVASEALKPKPTSTPTPTSEPALPPDRIKIPEIELDSEVTPIGWTAVEQEGTVTRVWQVADFVVGWHETSAYPGQVGNTVLNGHHNIRGQVFRYLVDLEPGDQILVYAEDQEFGYEVTERHILKEKGEPLDVRRENAKWIEPTEDERLTLITCWPYTNNTHRLVVVAKPMATHSIEGLDE